MRRRLILRARRGGRWVLVVAAGAIVAALAVALLGLATGQLQRLWRDPAPALRFSMNRMEEGYVLQIPDRDAAARLSHAHGCDGLEAETRMAGGADTDETDLRLLVEGRSSDTVTITGMRALITDRTPPKGGAIAFCAGGGEVGPIPLAFELDSKSRTPPAVRMKTHLGRTRSVGPYFGAHHLVTVAEHEVVPFELTGIAHSHFVEWKIEVSADVAGRPRRFVIDDRGQPFRTAPLAASRDYHPLYEWRWDSEPQRLVIAPHPDPNDYPFLLSF
jgi:hypothetical protein